MAINSEVNRSEIVVRLFRCWSAARVLGENPLPGMQKAIAFYSPAPELSSACESLFCLTEALLGRGLVAGHSCSSVLSRDERALLMLLRHAPQAGHIHTSRAIPHGLPTALQLAAWSVLRALGEVLSDNTTANDNVQPFVRAGTCPFDETLPARPGSASPKKSETTEKKADVISIARPTKVARYSTRHG
ncbi:MAG: hypothetical protein AAGH53_04175 [Pseudomonadota bacterium]